ncbi:MAG: alanine racemase [Deltaproteobacteria bacterium]|nr:alanine racemase [Deltaproteobacteria bacterium]
MTSVPAQDAPAEYTVEVRPTTARIDHAALANNLRRVATHIGSDRRILAVVKADAYGHGAIDAARTFAAQGAWGLAVSLVEEGVELREGGIHAPVVVLGGVVPGSQDVIVHRQLTPVVWSLEHLHLLSAAVRRAGARPLSVHLKIDTGMSRLGVLPRNLAPVLEWFRRDAGASLVLEGVMTHLACADDCEDDLSNARQLTRFADCLGTIAASGLRPALRHVSNSAALVRFPNARYDMVRPGIALYGAASGRDVQLPDLQLAMEVGSRVLAVRTLPAGARISYGGRHRLERDARVAVVPVGYADGYPRSMSGQAQMLVRGHRCAVLGVITMDVCMLDVTDLPDVRAGERVILMGQQGAQRLGVHTLAEWASVLPYEILCGISKRVPRHRA